MPAESLKLYSKAARFAIALLVVFAPLMVSVRSANSLGPANEQVSVAPKVLYIVLNPKNFTGGADAILLGRSRSVFKDTLKDRAIVRLPEDGANFDICDPKQVCDRIQITWFRRTITVNIICKKEHSETTEFASTEPRNGEEVDLILKQIFRNVATHNTLPH
jgi:hypothetical protein